MFDFFTKFFKRRKLENCGWDLEAMVKEGIITEEEMLRIKKDRADENLKNYLKYKKK